MIGLNPESNLVEIIEIVNTHGLLVSNFIQNTKVPYQIHNRYLSDLSMQQ